MARNAPRLPAHGLSWPHASGARASRRMLLLAPALLAPALLASGRSHAAARLEPAGQGVRLLLPLTGSGGPARLFSLSQPARLVIDLPGHAVRGSLDTTGAGPVSGLRQGQFRAGVTRIVLDLDRPVALRRAAIEQGREGRALVLELAPGTEAQFRSLAQGRSVALAGPSQSGQRAPTAQSAEAPARRPPAPPRPFVVVLDPGHGGKDPGAIGLSGVHEKRITLLTALELRRRLQARGTTVHLTRSNDSFVALTERVRIAQAREADLFVSLHADSAPSRSIRGVSVYTLALEASDEFAASLAARENAADQVAGPSFPGVSPEVARILFSLVRRDTLNTASELAGTLVERMGKAAPLLPQPHRQAGFVVLKAPDVPSVLVELGFLSNRDDERKLRDARHRAKLAEALADALLEHRALRPPADATAVAGTR